MFSQVENADVGGWEVKERNKERKYLNEAQQA
jgi:hypothetical protein